MPRYIPGTAVSTGCAQLRNGEKDPGDKNVRDLDEKLAAAVRERDALQTALQESWGDLLAAMDACRAEWLENVHRVELERAARYTAAVDQLAAARRELTDWQALRLSVESTPQPAGAYWSAAEVMSDRLARPSGEHELVETVMAVLVDDAGGLRELTEGAATEGR